MGKIRRKHSSAFKARVSLVALEGRETISEIASKYGIHPNQVSKWKSRAEELLKTGFSQKDQSTRIKEKDHLIEDLYRKTGKLEYSLDWPKKSLGLIPKRNLSKSCEAHHKYPYLLTNLDIDKPDQVWCSDIT